MPYQKRNQNVKVQLINHEQDTLFFDEFSVTLQAKPLEVLYTADYYAYGEVMREWKHADLDKHRYGYQGDFAEKDPETGFSHFELREYDSKIGRWLVPDPMREFWSPYVGMGNNPVNLTDSNGGETDPTPGALNDAGTHTWGLNANTGAYEWVDIMQGIDVVSTALPKSSVIDNVANFLNGFANAVTSNQFGGVGRDEYMIENNESFSEGAYAGDIASVAMGLFEIGAGGGMSAGGGVVTVGSGGLLSFISIPVLVVGGAIAAKGAINVGTASAHLSNHQYNFAKKKVETPKGFKETKEFGYPHGQKVYEYKGKYYSRDVDSHNGGVWKVFEAIKGKLKRIGTADENLNIFKD